MKEIQGYNIILQATTPDGNTKYFAGTTENTFDINVETEESQTKADKGTPRTTGKYYTGTFSINGLVSINETGDETENADRDDVISLTIGMQKHHFVYKIEGGAKEYTGELMITSYSESTNSDEKGTFSVNCKVDGEITPVTV